MFCCNVWLLLIGITCIARTPALSYHRSVMPYLQPMCLHAADIGSTGKPKKSWVKKNLSYSFYTSRLRCNNSPPSPCFASYMRVAASPGNYFLDSDSARWPRFGASTNFTQANRSSRWNFVNNSHAVLKLFNPFYTANARRCSTQLTPTLQNR